VKKEESGATRTLFEHFKMNVNLNSYLNLMNATGIYPHRGNLRFYLKYLFGDIEFANKTMLDIGGGSGLFTLFGGVMGLRKGVCLEPQTVGSRTGESKMFSDYSRQLGLSNVELISDTLQKFLYSGKFDIILLHFSINHLDENACINLLTDRWARDTYEKIFQRLDDLAAPNAHLIIVDCSRYNAFPAIGLKNPFAPNIVWRKHQAPEVWAEMLSRHNFIAPEIRWSSLNTLRGLGRVLFANQVVAFLTYGTFCLRMQHTAQELTIRKTISQVLE
jgi:hypothetical protein